MEPTDKLWSERYTLDLPSEISRDKSELDYLRRTNIEAAAAAHRPQLKQVRARKFRPIITRRSSLVAHSVEILWMSDSAGEASACSTPIMHSAEEVRRNSGALIHAEDEMESISPLSESDTPVGEICRDSGVSVEDGDQDEIQNPSDATKASDLTDASRRDSGVSIEDEDEVAYSIRSAKSTDSVEDTRRDSGVVIDDDEVERPHQSKCH